MPLILAIEPDPRQAAQIAAIARNRVGAELMLADTTEGALDVIGNRVPDLVLVPALLSPQDDAALAAALRVIAAAAHVRTLTIPLLSAAPKRARVVGMLAKWRRGKSESPEPDGCDPAIFAEQISVYLKEAAAERAALEMAAAADEPALEAAPAAYAVDTAHAVSAEETPHAGWFEETPHAGYVEETPLAAYGLEMPQATGAPETLQADRELEPPHAADGIIAPLVSVEEPSIAFEEPRFFVEEPAGPVEETRAVSAEPVPVEQEPTLAIPEPAPVMDEPVGVEERTPSFELTEAIGRERHLADTREPQAEEELVFELTLDDTDVMFFDQPAATTIAAPIVKAIASPPVAIEVVAARDERAPSEATSLHDDRSEELATIEEFSGELTVPDGLHARETQVTADPPRRSEHWMPMSNGIERLWPPLEGVLAEFADALELLDQAEVATAASSSGHQINNRREALVDKVLREPSTAPSLAAVQPTLPVHPAAVALGAVAGPLAPRVPPLAAVPLPPAAVDTPKSEWVELIDSLRQDIERMRSAPPAQPIPTRAPQPVAAPFVAVPLVAAAFVAVPSDDAVTAPRTKRRAKTPHPIQDEWGFFDPEQCGFAALLAKLDEMTDGCEEPDAHAK
jgi:hypothetical protein